MRRFYSLKSLTIFLFCLLPMGMLAQEEVLPAPVFTYVGNDCDRVAFEVDYNAELNYHLRLNGDSVPVGTGRIEVPGALPGETYLLTGFVDRGDTIFSESSSLSHALQPTPENPITIPYNACQQEGVIPADALVQTTGTTRWYASETAAIPLAETPLIDKNVVQNLRYWVSQVTAYGCESGRSLLTVRVRYMPAAPVVVSYQSCQTAGMQSWVSLVTASETLRWYETATSSEVLGTVPDFNRNVVQQSAYWVSQISDEGCESPRVQVSVSVFPRMVVPVVNSYEACPTGVAGDTQAWSSLVSATGTLRWYDSSTSLTPLANIPDFDKNTPQNTTYWVSQVSAEGCESDRVAVNVHVYQLAQAPFVSNYLACQETGTQLWSSLVSATGTLRWYDAETALTPVIAPYQFDKSQVQHITYYVTQVSSEGCESAKAAVSVMVKQVPVAYAGEDAVICAGESVTLGQMAAEGVSYQWLPAALVEQPDAATTRTRALNTTTQFTLVAANTSMTSCSSTDQITVSVVAKPQLSLNSSNQAICKNGSKTLSVTAQEGVSYTWQPADKLLYPVGSEVTTIALDAPQTYVVKASYDLMPTCFSELETTVYTVDPPVAEAGDDVYVCAGQTARLGMQAVYNVDYSWRPETALEDATVANPTTLPVERDQQFTLTATLSSAPYCQSTDQVMVHKVTLPNIYQVSGDDYYCEGSPANLPVRLSNSELNVEYALYKNGYFSGNWVMGTGGPLVWNDNDEGVYTVVARIAGTQCQQQMQGSATIRQVARPSATVYNVKPIACPGEGTTINVDFTGTAPYQFGMSIGTSYQTYTSNSDSYSFAYTPFDSTAIVIWQITDAYCKQTFTQEDAPMTILDVESASDFRIHVVDPKGNREMICAGDTLELYINYSGTDATVQWSTSEIGSRIVVSPAVTTQYTVRAETSTGCVVEDAVEIKVASSEPLKIIGLKDPPYYCTTDEPMQLAGYPVGGSFSSVPPSLMQGDMLTPGNITASTDAVITYTYATGGCVQDTSVTVYVSALLGVDWCVTPELAPYRAEYVYCQPNPDSPKQRLPLQGTPQQKNGTWTLQKSEGDAEIKVISDKLSTAEFINVTPGTYWITYKVTDEFGCESSKTKKVQISNKVQELIDNEGLYVAPNDTLCRKDTYARVYADRQGGTFKLSTPAMLVSQENGVAIINPSKAASLGRQTAIYTIADDKGCPHAYSVTFYIQSPVNIHPFGLKKSYCSYDEDVPIKVSSATPTKGTISIKRSNGTFVLEPMDKDNNPYFRPTWGPDTYTIVYEYSDNYCTDTYSETVSVYDPPVINLNLNSDYCSGEVITMNAQPNGGTYTTDALEGALVNFKFYTDRAGLGVHKIAYTVNDTHGCVSSDSTDIQVHGLATMSIFGLDDKYCEPMGSVEVGGFPIEYGTVSFTGPDFLQDLGGGKALIDLSQGNFNTSYKVVFHYVETYLNSQLQTQTCESTVSKSFRILNESSDFGGYTDGEVLCGDRKEVLLTANFAEHVRFEFSDASAVGFVDNGDGTAYLYPELLPVGMYAVTMYHDYVENDVVICTTQKTKSFSVSRINDIASLQFYCDNNHTGVRLPYTQVGVTYRLYVNNLLVDEKVGDGNPLDFPGIESTHALVKIDAVLGNCVREMTAGANLADLQLLSTINQVSCYNMGDGQYIARVTGGRAPYIHSITGPVNISDSVATALLPGDYVYRVTDQVGCFVTQNFTISQPDTLTVKAQGHDVECSGSTTGRVQAIPTGGTGAMNYQWTDLQTSLVIGNTASLSDLATGNYRVDVYDQNGCHAWDDATLLAPDPLQVEVSSITSIPVIGATTGAIEVQVKGGVTPYTYSWTGKSITEATRGLQNQENLAAGNYYLTVTDARSCAVYASAAVVEPSPYQVDVTVRNVSCAGLSDGYLYVEASGPSLPYTYTWTYPDGSKVYAKDISLLAAGMYHLLISDEAGNTYENDYQITEPLAMRAEITMTSQLSVACYGDSTAHIDLYLGGGVAPYHIDWLGIGAEQLLDSLHAIHLPAATYPISITDANGCNLQLSATVTQPTTALLISTANITQNSCHDATEGAISLQVEGGSAPYAYLWTGPNVNPTERDQVALPAGAMYTVQITDNNNCQVVASYQLNNPDALLLQAIPTNLSCNQAGDGSLTAVVSGGSYPYSYAWYNASSQQVSSDSVCIQQPAGAYVLEVTDALHCQGRTSIALTEPEILNIQVSTTDVRCANETNGTVSASVSGGTQPYTYQWYALPNETDVISTQSAVSDLAGGLYRVIVTDASQCVKSSDAAVVNNPTALQLTEEHTNVAEYGLSTGVILLSVEGGKQPYTVDWKAGPGITETNRHDLLLTQLPAGNYYVEVIDANGCASTLTVAVLQPEKLNVTATISPVVCAGESSGSIIIQVTGGQQPYSFLWTTTEGYSSTQQNIGNLPAAFYSLQLTDAAGAVYTNTYEVSAALPIQISTATTLSQLSVDCYGGKNGRIALHLEGGQAPYQVAWTGPDVPAVISDSSCLSNLGAGLYRVVVTDANGCVNDSYSQQITGPDAPLEITGIITENACYGQHEGKIDLSVTGGQAPYSFAWSGGEGLQPDAQNQTTLYSGQTYRVEVSDQNRCRMAKVFTMAQRTPLQLQLTAQSVSCNGFADGGVEAVCAGGETPYTPLWESSDKHYSFNVFATDHLPADTYTFTLTDANGCVLAQSIELTQPQPLSVSVEATDVLCNGLDDGEAYARVPENAGTKPYTFQWYKDYVEYAQGARITNLGEGYYQIKVEDANGCVANGVQHIYASTPIAIHVDKLVDVQIHGEATGSIELSVTGGTAPLTYHWTGAGIDPAHASELNQYNLTAGKYQFTVSDAYMCSVDTLLEIKQPESLSVEVRIQDRKCAKDEGFIELAIAGGKAPYTSTWTRNGVFFSNDINIYHLTAGSYQVQIKDSEGNGYTNTWVISERIPVAWNLLESSRTQLNCFGDSNGIINIEVSGGVRPYHIQWHGPELDKENVYSLYNLMPGTYTAYLTDDNGCTPVAQPSVSVVQPQKLEIEAVLLQNICNEDEKGSIQLTVSGGTPQYQFAWSGYNVQPDAQNQSALAPGNYTLRLSDAHACSLDTVFTMIEPMPLASTMTAATQACYAEDFALTFQLVGKAPWNIEYTDGYNIYQTEATEKTWVAKCNPSQNAQFRAISITDGNGCHTKLPNPVDVTMHAQPTLTVTKADTDCCLGGVAYLTVAFSNEGPWNVRYTDGNTIYQVGPFVNAQDSIALAPTQTGTTTYRLLSVSNEYCSTDLDVSYSVEVYAYPELSVNLTPYVCEPEKVLAELNATGTAPWHVVYYLNGEKQTVELTEPYTLLSWELNQVDNEFVFESVRSGQHCQTRLDKTMHAQVGLLPKDAVAIVGPTQVCRNTTVGFTTPQIPYATSYEWEFPHGYTIVSGLGSTELLVAVADDAESGELRVYGKNECGRGGYTNTYINVTPRIATTGQMTTPQFVCANESMFQLSVSDVEGATEYEWEVPYGYEIVSGQHTRSILVTLNEFAVNGTVSVTPRNACTQGSPIQRHIAIRSLPLAEAGANFNTYCATSAQLRGNAAAGTTSKWTLLQGRANFDDEHSSKAMVTDLLFGENIFRWDVNDGYCTAFDTVVVTNDNPGITQPEFTETTICDDEILLRAAEPVFGKGRWTLIAGDGRVLTPDTCETWVKELGYKVTNVVRWEVYYNNCSNAVDVRINSNDLSRLADAGEDGETATDSYRLSARVVTHPNVKGSWKVVAGSGTIDDPTQPNTTVRGLAPGYNTIRWTLEGLGCTAYDEVRVRYIDDPIASFTVEKDKGCSPFAVYFNNTTVGEAEYMWYFGDGATSTQRSPEHVFEKPGSYEVRLVATGKNRNDECSKTIVVYNPPVADFSVSPNLLYLPNAEAHFLLSEADTKSWYWDFGDGSTSTESNPIHQYISDGQFDVQLIVADEHGCPDTLLVNNCVTVVKGSFIVFPNAFVPNVQSACGGVYKDDERRLDIFYPVSRNVATYQLQIFNTWGNQVFESNDLHTGWDGYYLGKCAAQGTYVYKAEGKYQDGTSFRVSGNVLLIR